MLLQLANVSKYLVQIEQDGLYFDAISVSCQMSSCFYFREINSSLTAYRVKVASINGNGVQGPSNIAIASKILCIVWSYIV